MKIVNHTGYPDEFIAAVLQECVDGYIELHAQPHSEVEFIICDKMEEVKSIRNNLVDDSGDGDYNGIFLPPKAKTDTLTILALLNEREAKGAERFFREKRRGTLRDADIPDREERGVALMAFFEFMEMIQHEYSHLCSYERVMDATDWVDPLMMGHDWNYHLHDEFIARYRGTRAMLKYAKPYMESNLVYSLWMGTYNDLITDFKEQITAIRLWLKKEAMGIEQESTLFMKANGMTAQDMVMDLEHELGHRLYFKGELNDRGFPKLSPIEVVEFMTFKDTAHHTIPIMYAVKNSYATYQGAQLSGLIQAFHDHMSDLLGKSDGFEMKDEYLDLVKVIGIEYYEYTDAEKIKKTLESYISMFEKWAM